MFREITIIVNSTERKEKKKRISGHDPISNCPISRLRAPIRPEKDFLNFLNEQPRSSTSICPNTFAGSRMMPRSQQLTSIFHQSHAVHTRPSFFSLARSALLSSVSLFAFTKKKNNVKFFGAASHSSFRNFASVSLALVSRRPKKRTVRFVQPIKSPSAINHR